MDSLKLPQEKLVDDLCHMFYEDTKQFWSQREQPTVKDVMKWFVIKGIITEKD